MLHKYTQSAGNYAQSTSVIRKQSFPSKRPSFLAKIPDMSAICVKVVAKCQSAGPLRSAGSSKTKSRDYLTSVGRGQFLSLGRTWTGQVHVIWKDSLDFYFQFENKCILSQFGYWATFPVVSKSSISTAIFVHITLSHPTSLDLIVTAVDPNTITRQNCPITRLRERTMKLVVAQLAPFLALGRLPTMCSSFPSLCKGGSRPRGLLKKIALFFPHLPSKNKFQTMQFSFLDQISQEDSIFNPKIYIADCEPLNRAF